VPAVAVGETAAGVITPYPDLDLDITGKRAAILRQRLAIGVHYHAIEVKDHRVLVMMLMPLLGDGADPKHRSEYGGA